MIMVMKINRRAYKHQPQALPSPPLLLPLLRLLLLPMKQQSLNPNTLPRSESNRKSKALDLNKAREETILTMKKAVQRTKMMVVVVVERCRESQAGRCRPREVVLVQGTMEQKTSGGRSSYSTPARQQSMQ